MKPDEKPTLLVSACLLGQAVRYDGRSCPDPGVQSLAERFELVPVCPECLGGLPTPRTASEIDTTSQGVRVLGEDGEDRTSAFFSGASACALIALQHGCSAAVMKANSPSCGSGRIYDGSFSGTLVEGDGIAVRLLKAAGIAVVDEHRIDEL